jgi:putative signal transducing protein
MFCPKCRCEYQAGFSKCADCDVDLVDEAPPVDIKIAEWKEMVTIAKISDYAFLLVAKSLLQDAGIPYLAKNEGVQDLFGLGRIGTGFSIVAQPVELQVPPELVDDAVQLLDEIESTEGP